jgi:hypothetical protein
MKKVLLFLLCTGLLLGNSSFAQTATTKMAAADEPTAANVLKWAKEELPKIEQLSAKLGKMKLHGAEDQRKLVKQQELLRNVQQRFEAIIAKGTKLTAAEARRHDTWFRNAIAKGIDDCLTANPGSECCFGCKNGGGSGYGSFWCFVNCFVIQFPGLD